LRAVALAGVVVCAAGIARGEGPAKEPAARPSVRGSVPVTPYLIGPADVLRVAVWKEPDLNVDVTVRVDGMISFTLLGDLEAAGLTPTKLAENIAKRLERFVDAPKITVSVSQANSARFYVLGMVAKPGEFPLASRSTVLQALALAGGFKEFAKPESIVIVREDQTVVPVNYKRIAEGKDVSQNVVLSRGDTIVVP
jgi:polysaccharide export outer membrane protein